MSNLLIADAGSTKTDWALLDTLDRNVCIFQTAGINPVTGDEDNIREVLGTAFSNFEISSAINKIYFYGAGCATKEICKRMEFLLKETFGCTDTTAMSDLNGAARSLFGTDSGIACICGTGSNSGLYNGKEIVKNVPSLGYILGDEGSGSAIGKRLLSDFLKGILSYDICKCFEIETGITLSTAIEKTYREPSPNRFLASLVPFISRNLDKAELRNLVKDEFSRFFQRNIKQYDDSLTIPIAFTGSIAFHFSELLRESAESLGINILKITKSPLEGLIEYHLNYE